MVEAIRTDFNEEVKYWTKKDLKELLSDDMENIKHAPEYLKADKDIGMMVLKTELGYIKYLPESLRDDKEFLIDNISDVWRAGDKFFAHLSHNLLSDKDFVIKMIQKLPDLYKYIPRKLRRDKDIYLLATYHLAQADKRLRIDQDLNLQKLLNGTSQYYYDDIHRTLKSNKEFVCKALDKGVIIKFYRLHSELQKDRDIVIWYLKKQIENPYEDQYRVGQIPKKLMLDPELLELYIKNWSYLLPKYSFGKDAIPILKKTKDQGQKVAYLELLKKNLLSDKKIVLDAIKDNPDNFWFAGDYRLDEECLDLAVKRQEIKNPLAKFYSYHQINDIKASEIDENLAKKFIKINPYVINDLPKRLLSNKNIVLQAVSTLGFDALNILPHNSIDKDILMTCAKVERNYWRLDLSAWNHIIENDEDLLKELAKLSHRYFCLLPRHLRDNESYIRDLFRDNSTAFWLKSEYFWTSLLQFLPNKLKNEKEIVSLFTTSEDLEHWSGKFRKDKKLLLKVLKSSGWDFKFDKYINPELKDDLAFMKEAVKLSGGNLFHASPRLKDNKSLVNLALEKKAHALKYASDRLKNDKAIVLKAVNKTPSSFKHASKELRSNIKFLKKTFNSEPLEMFHNCHCTLRRQPEIYIPAIKENPRCILRFSTNAITKLNMEELTKNERSSVYEAYQQKVGDQDIFLMAKAKSKMLKEPENIIRIKNKLGIL